MNDVQPEGQSIDRELADLIAAGASIEEATDKVMAPYQTTLLGDRRVWCCVRNIARTVQRQHDRRIEDRAFEDAANLENVSGGGRYGIRYGIRLKSRHAARLLLPKTTFRLGDGTEVDWGSATAGQHLMRIAWQAGQVAAINSDIGRHRAAVTLIETHGVACLDDIDGWVDLLADTRAV